MPPLTWDSEHPPEEPPPDADPLIWRLAYGLRGDHCRTDAAGRCAACREPAPCRLLTVALRGLVLAEARGDRYRRFLDLDNAGPGPEASSRAPEDAGPGPEARGRAPEDAGPGPGTELINRPYPGRRGESAG